MNTYDFYTGMSFQAYEWLGAHVEENRVVFRTYAPNLSLHKEVKSNLFRISSTF